jgi:hypothetical protein
MREEESDSCGRRGMTKRDICGVERAGFRDGERNSAEKRGAKG